MKFTASRIATVTGGSLSGPDVETSGATQDSRAIAVDQLFVPIVAERDGHEFIDAACDAGAAAYLTHREPRGRTAIVVDDTMRAMNALAVEARRMIAGPVIGITGSVGKTSTKDLLAGALGQSMKTHASVKSFNNEIGVPLTLLNTPGDAQAVVIEMGARGVGHIESLCTVASPTVGIVTTVVAAHTGEFGSVDAIAVAKGELIEALPADGLAVLNGDNTRVLAMKSRTNAAVLTFGSSASCDVRVASVELDDELRAIFTIESEWGTVRAAPPTRGAHMATNVAAAVGTALWLGASIDEVESGLTHVEVSPWRMEVGRSESGALIINDAYNANPTSMRGALDSLANLPQKRKIAIVGYMGELGEREQQDHADIARAIREIGAEMIAVGTSLYGSAPVADPIAFLEASRALDADTAILVKGSRSAGLEKFASALLVR